MTGFLPCEVFLAFCASLLAGSHKQLPKRAAIKNEMKDLRRGINPQLVLPGLRPRKSADWNSPGVGQANIYEVAGNVRSGYVVDRLRCRIFAREFSFAQAGTGLLFRFGP